MVGSSRGIQHQYLIDTADHQNRVSRLLRLVSHVFNSLSYNRSASTNYLIEDDRAFKGDILLRDHSPEEVLVIVSLWANFLVSRQYKEHQ